MQRPRSRSPTEVTKLDDLRSGVTVRLCGLKGAAHLNGMTGVCKDWDATAGRWIVSLDSGEEKSLKPDNLSIEPGEECEDNPACSDYEVEDERDDFQRMASDLESGFVCCDGLTSAREALEKKEMRLEFGGVNDADERARCLDLVCELMTASERKLRGVSFAACALTADDIRKLAAALREASGLELTALGISKNPGVEQEAWRELFEAVPRKVMWLDFGDNQLSDSDIEPLIAGLEGRDDLDKLYLDGNRLKDVVKLCAVLPNTGITNLDLGDNDVDDGGAQDIAAVLPQTVVTNLVLGSNPITEEGINSIFTLLPRSSLDVLYLDNTGVTDECLRGLSALLSDCSLSELHMDNTRISDAGVRALLPHLADAELTYIDISGNNISEETTKMLAESVSQQAIDVELEEGTVEE